MRRSATAAMSTMRSGRHVDGAGDDLLGQPQRQGDGVVLELGDDLVARGVQRLGRTGHRVQRRLDLGAGGGQAGGAPLGLAGRTGLLADLVGVGVSR